MSLVINPQSSHCLLMGTKAGFKAGHGKARAPYPVYFSAPCLNFIVAEKFSGFFAVVRTLRKIQ
jgi:hypothetical protein